MDTEQSSIAELAHSGKVPKESYVIFDQVLMSEGLWNNRYYSRDEIEKAFHETDWKSRENRHLFLDHHDQEAGEWLGEVEHPYFKFDTLYGNLVIHDPQWALKFKNGKPKLGISPKVVGEEDIKNKAMRNFTYKNFSVVVTPAVKTAYINNSKIPEPVQVGDSKVEVELKRTDAKDIKENNGAFEKLSEAQKVLDSKLERPIQKTKEEINMEEKDMADLFELFEAKKLSVTKVMRKADDIRTDGESYKDALRRAGKLLEEEATVEEETEKEEEKKEETPKEETPKEEAPKEEVPKEEAPKEEAEGIKEQVKEMAKQIMTLTAQNDKPAKAKIEKIKDVKELSETSTDREVDLGLLEFLRRDMGVD